MSYFSRLKDISFIRKCLLFTTHFLGYLNRVIPKKEKQILFYDSGRGFLDDNTEALYSWMCMHGYDKRYKLVVCVPRETTRLPFSHYEPIGALKGIWAYLRSKYVFYSFGDFRIEPSKKQVVINQWHGTPLKTIGKLTNYSVYANERLDCFTYVLSASDFFKPILAKAFGCDESKVMVLGHTRIDYLFSTKEALACIGIEKGNYKKLFLWMPTFRTSNDGRFHDLGSGENTSLPIAGTYAELELLNRFLIARKALLVVKVHPLATFKSNKNFSNILVLKNEDTISRGVRLYELVKEFDALITDYSSIFCDYLVLDRPMAFTLDDMEAYGHNRGFILSDLTNYMPGHHVRTMDDFRAFIDDCIHDKDPYAAERKRVLPFFCKYSDGNNCKRLLEKVHITL